MDITEYLRYLALLNSQDLESAHYRYYEPDIRFAIPGTVIDGRDAVLRWFQRVHAGVFETMVPVAIEISADASHIRATLEVTFFLVEDTTLSPLGDAGQAGDAFSVRNIVGYDVTDRNTFSALTCAVEAPQMLASRESSGRPHSR